MGVVRRGRGGAAGAGFGRRQVLGALLLALFALDGALAWQERTSPDGGFRPPWSSSSRGRRAFPRGTGAGNGVDAELMRGLADLHGLLAMATSSEASASFSSSPSLGGAKRTASQGAPSLDLTPQRIAELLESIPQETLARSSKSKDQHLEELLGGVPDFSDIAEFTLEPSPVHIEGRAQGSAQTRTDASARSVHRRFLKSLLDNIVGFFRNEPEFSPPPAPSVPKADRNISYAAAPSNARLIAEGVLTGIGSVFIPTLANSSSGPESVAKLQMCYDPRKLRDQFYVEDMFDLQDEEAQNIASSDIDAFIDVMEGDGDRSTLEAINDIVLKMPAAALKVFKHISKVLKKLAPYMLQMIKHAYDCGMLNIVLGLLMMFVVGMFPFLIFIIVPLSVVLLGYEVYNQIKTLIETWNRDWFEFGKATGVLTAYIGSMVIAYKLSKTSDKKASYSCPVKKARFFGWFRRSKPCSVNIPYKHKGVVKNENLYWTNENYRFRKTRVFQRDDLIGTGRRRRLNLIRMRGGKAPKGPDGEPVNLHHIDQTMRGPIAELSATFHQKNYKILHRYRGPSRIDRPKFNAWKRAYWKDRYRQIIANSDASDELRRQANWTVTEWADEPILVRDVDYAEATQNLGQQVSDLCDFYLQDQSWSDLDIVYWTVKALKGSIRRVAEDTDAHSESRKAAGPTTCAWSPTCSTRDIPLEHLSHVESRLAQNVEQRHPFTYSPASNGVLPGIPDAALSIQVMPSRGSVALTLREHILISPETLFSGTATALPDESQRPTVFALQNRHCDSHLHRNNTFALFVKGVDKPVDSRLHNMTRPNEFDVLMQYVPYPAPVEPTARVSVVAATSSEIQVRVPPVLPYLEADGDSSFGAAMPRLSFSAFAVPSGTGKTASDVVCYPGSRSSYSKEGRRELLAGTAGSASPSLDVTVSSLEPGTEYDVFVVVSNAGGASHVFAPVAGVATEPEALEEDSSEAAGLPGGAVFHIAFVVLCGLMTLVAAAWVALRKRSGKTIIPEAVLPARWQSTDASSV